MKPFSLFHGLFLGVLFVTTTLAQATTEVGFGSNRIVNEDDEAVWVEIKRSGDLSVTSVVNFYELWSDSGTTLGQSELLYNHATAPSAVWFYSNTSRYGTILFNAGVASVLVPYSISNDQEVESDERLYFELRNASSGTTIGDDSLYVKVYDDDEVIPALSIQAGTPTNEGDLTNAFVYINEATTHDVTLRVSTYYGTYREANYPAQNDYAGWEDKLVTIKAGDSDGREYLRIQTYQNDDPNDAEYEDFAICIEIGTVSGATLVGSNCIKQTIRDVPITQSLPTLDIMEGGIGQEGGTAPTYAKLSEATDHAVTFLVSTWRSTYQQANYPEAESDYQGLIDAPFIIPAGATQVAIPIVILQNDDPTEPLYESTEVCINTGSLSGATLGTACTPLVIMDVPVTEPEVPPVVMDQNIIYTDTLNSLWSNVSSGVTINLAASPAAEGSYSMRAEFTASEATLAFATNGFVTDGYDTLSFLVMNEAINSEVGISLGIKRSDGSTTYRSLSSYLANGRLLQNIWEEINIPLADLSANNATVTSVIIQSSTTGILYVDRWLFTNQSEVTNCTAPPSPTTPQLLPPTNLRLNY